MKRRLAKSLPSLSPVPSELPNLSEHEVGFLRDLVFNSKRLLVLTGAGLSTESGIPDYRSPNRPEYTPLQDADFRHNAKVRRRYWARSSAGFDRLRNASPNFGHEALAELEKVRSEGGKRTWNITQNVDRLLHRAGVERVLELHGTVFEVGCLDCGVRLSRLMVQELLEEANPSLFTTSTIDSLQTRPDGDADVSGAVEEAFKLPVPPGCEQTGSCRGALKPEVVFHGGAIPRFVTEQSIHIATHSDALLILGTTLSTFSAFRLVKRAFENPETKIGIVNFGETRADALVHQHASRAMKIEHSVAEVLRQITHDMNRTE